MDPLMLAWSRAQIYFVRMKSSVPVTIHNRLVANVLLRTSVFEKKLFGRGAHGGAQFFQRTPFRLGHDRGNVLHVGGFTTLAAIWYRRKVGAIGFEHKLIKWRCGQCI